MKQNTEPAFKVIRVLLEMHHFHRLFSDIPTKYEAPEESVLSFVVVADCDLVFVFGLFGCMPQSMASDYSI